MGFDNEHGHNHQQVELWANRSRYVGQFRKGNKHGDGKLIWQDQSTYHGGWKKGHMHGAGFQTFPDGKIYQG